MRRIGTALAAGALLVAMPSDAGNAWTAADTDPVLLAAGDIADCTLSGDEATAAILDAHPDGTVATLGDSVYPDGALSEFRECFDPTWGRHKARIKPAVGNHEYQTPGAAGYFEYFGAAAGPAGKGWYSYDVGAWHVIVLNSNCTVVACAPGSEQELWLRADLAAHATECTLAYWHHPLFTSGFHRHDDNLPLVKPFWDALYEHGADVVLAGHDHDYERFAPQTPLGAADGAYGIRQFVVGTGGANLRPLNGAAAANSEVFASTTYGVLRLVLRAGGYDWQFLPEAGKTFTDGGSADCHGAPDLSPPPKTTLSSSHSSEWSSDRTVEVAWSGASDEGSGVDGFSYSWTQGAVDVPDEVKDVEETATQTTSEELGDGSWWFHLRTVDNAGNWSDAAHLGPFRIDGTAPGNPTLSSPSHTPNDWSNDATVEVAWSGASDPHSGVDGYSYEWSQSSTTTPDDAKEPGGSSTISSTLPEGDSWFHLRTVDAAGNWSAAVHLGPFRIDTTAPANPALSSTSHTVGTWSNEATVVVGWSGASGNTFQYAWSPHEATIPESEPETSETRVVSNRPDGSWWFHVRARDDSGSWSGTSHIGPFLIDTGAPETHVASTSAGIEFSASEPAGFRCSLDGGGYADCVSPVRYDNLPPGEHVFRVFARDRAGNDDRSPAELRWTIQPAPQPQPQPQRPPAAVRICRVPRLHGSTLKRARTLLARGGCRLGRVIYAYARVRRGLVLSQRPGAGKRFRLGTRVNVRVSRGALPRRR